MKVRTQNTTCRPNNRLHKLTAITHSRHRELWRVHAGGQLHAKSFRLTLVIITTRTHQTACIVWCVFFITHCVSYERWASVCEACYYNMIYSVVSTWCWHGHVTLTRDGFLSDVYLNDTFSRSPHFTHRRFVKMTNVRLSLQATSNIWNKRITSCHDHQLHWNTGKDL